MNKMPNKNKKKEKISANNKNSKRSKSVKPKKLLRQSESTVSLLNKKIKKKSSFDKDKISINKKILNNENNSFLTSIRDIISIKNEMDFLYNHLNLKFKYKNYYNNILTKNNNNNTNTNNYYSENKIKYNIKSYFSDKNSVKENNSPIKRSKIKAMDNLYLYKKKNTSYKIYHQPELITSGPIKFKLNQNSFFNSKYTNKRLNKKSHRIRNVFFPSISSCIFNDKNKFNVNKINSACKILLEKD